MGESFQKLKVPDLTGSDLEIYYSESIHSGIENFRRLIREFIWMKLLERGLDNKWRESMLDLKKVPREFDDYCVSISHSKSGALVGLAKGYKIGVDIETLDRVSEGLLNRISTANEQHQAPEPKWLFSAKESCWKATQKTWSIPTISQIETTNWQPLPNHWSSFEAQFEQNQLPGRGALVVISGICLSFFICP